MESDFSVFHRIDDCWNIPSEKFWKLAWQLVNYQGSVAAFWRQRVAGPVGERQSVTAKTPIEAALPSTPGEKEISLTQMATMHSDLFSFGKG